MLSIDGFTVVFDYKEFEVLLHNWTEDIKRQLSSELFCMQIIDENIGNVVSDLTDWVDRMDQCLHDNAGEENLTELLDAIEKESTKNDVAFDVLRQTSKNLEKQNRKIDSLIQQYTNKISISSEFEGVQLNIVRMCELVIGYVDSIVISGDSEINPEILSKTKKILSLLTDMSEELTSIFEKVPEQKHVEIEQKLINLDKMFGEELDYVRINSKTDEIFETVEEICSKFTIDIQEELSRLSNPDRVEQINQSLNKNIDRFVNDSQSNISDQIDEVFELLKKTFNERLVANILAEFQQISTFYHLNKLQEESIYSDYSETTKYLKLYRKVSEDQKHSINNIIEKNRKYRDCIEKTCEGFRLDYACLADLNTCKDKLQSEEVKVLRHLFGSNGTDVLSRLNYDKQDSQEVDYDKVGKYAWEEIDEIYDWRSRRSGETSERLQMIFEHAHNRLESIFTDIEGKLNEEQ